MRHKILPLLIKTALIMNNFYKFFLILLSSSFFTGTLDAQINISPTFYYDCQDSVKLNVQLFQNLPGNIQNDDVFSGVVNIGFPFEYYGVTRTQCVISSNGYISFNTAWANQGSPYRHYNLPSSDDAIFFSFHDIMPSPSNVQNIRFQTYGDPGSRKFVLEFCSISLYDMPGNVYTGQLVLYEGSNHIEIHIGTKMNEAFNNNSFIGLQNGTNRLTHPTYNTTVAQWTLSNTSFRYTPNGNTYTLSNISYSPLPVLRAINNNNIRWYASNNLSTPIATGQNLNIQNNPAVSYYIVTYQGTDNTCTGTFTYNYRDTVYRQTRVSDTVKSADTVCLHQLPHQYLNHTINNWGASKVFNVYRDRIGCDSVRQHTIFLKRIPNAVTRTICEQQLPFTWNGKTVTTTGTHTLVDTTRSAITRCDSITTLTLTVNPTLTRSMSQTICQQTLPFTWNGKTVTTAGTYTLVDTSASVVTGCDSITTLTLTVNPTLTRSISQTICQQTLPFTWNGKTVTTAGTHTLVDTTASAITGCDSITTLSLTVNATLTRNISQAICQQTLPFTWNGKTANSVGTHTLVDTTASTITGCDSITTLTLTVHPTLTRSLTQVICQQTLPFTWNGKTVNSVGNHTLVDTTASTITGCDSVTTLALTVNPTLTRSVTQVICQQTLPFIWNGKTVNSVGNHTLVDTTASTITGCDSITTLALTVHPTLTRSLTQTICQETLPFTWNGKTVNSVGNHTLVDTTASTITGCDSITTLQLRVHSSPVVRLGNDTAVCANIIYTINGTTPNAISYLWNTAATTPAISVSRPGTYSLSVTDNNNCTGKDTIVVTHLAVPVVNLGPDVNDCVDEGWSHTLQAGNNGATFLWDDNSTGQTRTVTENGRYIVWVTNSYGCRTSDTVNVINRLNPVVTLMPDTNICVADTIIIDGTTPDVASYSWSTGATTPAVRAYQTGKYKLIVTGTNGCLGTDSTYVTVHEYPVVDLGSDINKCVDRGHLEFLNARNAGDDYLWDNAYNGQVRVIDGSGTYWVAVTNRWHCTTHDTININFKWNPEVQLGNDTNVCEGREVLLDAGDDGIYYQWNTGMTSRTTVVDKDGLYTVAVTGENGCISMDSIQITQNGKAPQYAGIWVRNTGTHTFKFELVDPAHISGYIWDFGDGSPLSYSETPVHTFPASGNYVVRLKVLNGCGDASDTTTIHIKPTGIDETELLSDALRVYPLPVTEGKVTVEIMEGAKIKEIVIVSTLGQELERHTVGSLPVYTLDVSQYSAAAYYLRVVTDKGVVNRKIVIGR